jgi:predicted nucleic acid-binding protein
VFLVDSSIWIEFLTDGPLAQKCEKYLRDPSKLKTPTIVIYEVYKKIKRERTEEDALLAVSLINRTSVIQLSESIALLAADLSLLNSLPMADAIVYATALEEGCKIVTSDTHFRELENVVFIS